MPCVLVREEDAKKLEPSAATGTVSTMAFASQAIASPESMNMTAGYLKLKPGYDKEFICPVDEIDLFLEGSLTYICEGKIFTAQTGDIVFIEKGSTVKCSTEGGCFGFFVTYPLIKETLEALKKERDEGKQK
jgi:ethanolamine utilization protein EutQ